MEMERTKKLMDRMVEILNTNEVCKSFMNNFQNMACEKELTPEEWGKFKQELFFYLFIKLYQENKDIQKLVAKDAYEMLCKE